MLKKINPIFFFTVLFLPSLLYFCESALAIIWIKPLVQLFLLVVSLRNRSLRLLSLIFIVLVLWRALPLWQTSFKKLQQTPYSITGTIVKPNLQAKRKLSSFLILETTSFFSTKQIKQSYLKIKLTKPQTFPFYVFNISIHITAKKWHIEKNQQHTIIADKVYIRPFQEERASLLANNTLLFLIYKGTSILQGFTQEAYMTLLTGSSSFLSKQLKSNLNDLGIRHLFALSGLHIGLVYLTFFYILSFVSLRFSNKYTEGGLVLIIIRLLAMVLLGSYLWLIHMPITALRAFSMFAIYWIFTFLGYTIPLWFLFLLTLNFLTINSPYIISNIAFALSMLCISAILWILPFMPITYQHDSTFRKIQKNLIIAFSLSISIFICTFPLVINMQSVFSLFFPFNNIFHIFYLSTIFLPTIVFAVIVLLFSYFFHLPIILEKIAFLPTQFTGNLWHTLLSYNLQWFHYPIIITYKPTKLFIILYLIGFQCIAYISNSILHIKK